MGKKSGAILLLAILMLYPSIVFSMGDDSEDEELEAAIDQAASSPAPTATTSAVTTNPATPITQKTSQISAGKNYQKGAALAASIGIVSCAEGANTVLQNNVLGGTLIDSCLDSFQIAKKMKEAELKANQNANIGADSDLTTDASIMDSANSNEILDDFSKAYHISKEDLTNLMINSRGDPNTLGKEDLLDRLFKGKISRAQILSALSAAQKLSDQEKAEQINNSRLAGIMANLKYDIGSKLAKKTNSPTTSAKEKGKIIRQLASSSSSQKKDMSLSSPFSEVITPSDDPLFSNEVENYDDEPTVFDIVRKKYQEKFQLFKKP